MGIRNIIVRTAVAFAILGSTVLAGAGSHARARALASTKTITVISTQPWTDTGIDVVAGQIITISARGTITYNLGGDTSTPNGRPDVPSDPIFIAPNLTPLALIMRIGAALPHFEGSSRTFTAQLSGRLTLGVNDNLFGDNAGSYTATITY